MSNAKKITIGRGDYGKATKWMISKRIYTKSQLIEFFLNLGKSEKAALASAVVMLSPRLTARVTKNGPCDERGNISNPWGHLAYNEKLNRRVIKGVKEEQRFQFKRREKELEPRKREVKAEVKATKSTKATAKKTTTKKEANVEA